MHLLLPANLYTSDPRNSEEGDGINNNSNNNSNSTVSELAVRRRGSCGWIGCDLLSVQLGGVSERQQATGGGPRPATVLA